MSNPHGAPLRTFFALWPEAGLRDALAREAKQVADACRGRAMRSDTLHLTLVFLGATPPGKLDALREMMDATDVPAFTLALDRTGWWRHNGVAWAGTGTTPDALLALHGQLTRGADRLGFSLDVRPYAPHLTLARNAQRSPPAGIAPLPRWDVREFVLVASELRAEGPSYRVLHRRALRSAEPRADAA